MMNQKSIQKGFTLIELAIAAPILIILVIGCLQLYNNSTGQQALAESEIKMQQQSREAMIKMNQELRQATDYYEVPFDGIPQAKEILFIRPKSDLRSGQVSDYILVKYWFHESGKGVFSLLRAEQPHGQSDQFVGSELAFQPNQTAEDKKAYKIRALVKEATVIEPGKQSFFQQSPSKTNLIHVRLVTATYGLKKDPGNDGRTLEVKRKFRVDTDIHARNLNI